MPSDDKSSALHFFMGFCVGVVFIIISLVIPIAFNSSVRYEQINIMKKEAIGLGYAKYNPVSGQWEWNKHLDE